MSLRKFIVAFACMIAPGIGSQTTFAQTVAVDRPNNTSVEVWKPTATEVKAMEDQMAASLSEADTDLKIVQHANGMKSVDLKGRFQSVAVAKRNNDGSVSINCVENVEQAHKFLTSKNATRHTEIPATRKAEKE